MALTPDPLTGILPYKTVIYSCPKKSGKTEVGALIAAWFATCISPDGDECLVIATNLDQAVDRVFRGVTDCFMRNPVLRQGSVIQARGIQTPRNVQIKAIPGSYAGAAGANMGLTTWDELWGLLTESQRRLYEELTPVPTRLNSIRLITTYAGIVGESELLEDLYERGMAGQCLDEDLNIWVNKQASVFMYWDHLPRMPWQTEQYYMEALNEPGFRKTAFDRIHRNMWVLGEESFPLDDFKSCIQPDGWSMFEANKPNKKTVLAVGVDASENKDRAAITTVFRVGDKMYLGPRRWWQPSKEHPLDLENTMEAYLLELNNNFTISKVFYDKYQFMRSAQTLEKKGLPMELYQQTNQNMGIACGLFTDLMRYQKLVLYDDPALLAEASMASLKALPSGRGHVIVKDNRKKKIDSLIALAMALVAGQYIPESNRDFTDSFMFLS